MSLLSTSTPSGRNELLGWLNTLCGSEYPTIEALRDGAGYCTVIEAAASRLERNCSAAGFPELYGATQKALIAKKLLSRVDWSATSHVYEVVDPAQDSAFFQSICLKNVRILQRMVRECVLPDCSTEIHPDRLALGKLQDHLHFLSWLWNYIKKILSGYSKSEILRKAAGRTNLVEGVRSNRAMMLLQEKRIGVPLKDNSRVKSNSPPLVSPRRTAGMVSGNSRSLLSSKEAVVSSSKKNRKEISSPIPSSISPRQVRPFEKEVRRSSSSPSCYSSSSKKVSPEHGRVPYRDLSRGSEERSTPRTTLRKTNNPKINLGKDEVNTEFVVIPSVFKNRAVEIRKLVEELEELVLVEHEEYQNSISPPLQEKVDEALTGSHDDKEKMPRIPSLVSLVGLLEERDRLVRMYTDIEKMYHSKIRSGISTPLLMNIGAVLYPPQKL